ncbi:MAG: hypothetical protein U5L74_05785 [Ideonella sp.]|nr:hypothetical protein [Ideonella sp.]
MLVTLTLYPAAPLAAEADATLHQLYPQLLHKLLMNAVQALAHVLVAERRLEIKLTPTAPGPSCASSTAALASARTLAVACLNPFSLPSPKPEGLGLGLSLCETLLTRLDGRIEASHHTPRGAVFTIVLHLP